MRVISRRTDAGIQVFDESLEPLRVFPLPEFAGSWSISSGRDSLVYATCDEVVRLGPDGGEQWRFEFDPPGPGGETNMSDATFSADDSLVWVYAPSLLSGRAETDEWIVLDAATGEPRSRLPIATAGQGGQQFPLGDGRMMLDVGEGQDGSRIFLASPGDNVHDYGWDDRVLIDVAPGRRQFMTVDHQGQEDMILHAFPGGETLFRLAVADFGEDPEIGVVEWTGGYLDDETAVVVVYGEEEDTGGPWWRHYRVDTRSGKVLGDLGIVTIDETDLEPLGDRTYLITDTDGTLRRM
ncbi:hypothetical protein [Actinoplanes regularis]|uniref:PQQ-like domain-containing protein n=1 Tax=Actinoplanes regularis TaxID=52697 RepID=A0A238X2X3_9ACTN|nr:hypothetical protein [Actinoplanes regularis]GIE86395.1 hypothetical protein Are01nite_28750 [Actinoplanes regularis]SNR53316.1 hypothetical protein SAMN06264365_10320 [Actinoplanes regularis]